MGYKELQMEVFELIKDTKLSGYERFVILNEEIYKSRIKIARDRELIEFRFKNESSLNGLLAVFVGIVAAYVTILVGIGGNAEDVKYMFNLLNSAIVVGVVGGVVFSIIDSVRNKLKKKKQKPTSK